MTERLCVFHRSARVGTLRRDDNEQCGVGGKLVLGIVEDTAERMALAAESVAHGFVDHAGPSPMVARIRAVIRKRARRCLQLLRT